MTYRAMVAAYVAVLALTASASFVLTARACRSGRVRGDRGEAWFAIPAFPHPLRSQERKSFTRPTDGNASATRRRISRLRSARVMHH